MIIIIYLFSFITLKSHVPTIDTVPIAMVKSKCEVTEVVTLSKSRDHPVLSINKTSCYLPALMPNLLLVQPTSNMDQSNRPAPRTWTAFGPNRTRAKLS